MHPEILRELGAQRGREMRARAQRGRLARMISQAARAARRAPARADEADGFVVPAIPDFVDGSFRTEPAGDASGQVPAARHAA